MSSSGLLCCRLVILFLFFIGISQATSPAATDEKPTAYEMLRQYGFPAGLLPQGIMGYELDANTGHFTVYLNETCQFTVHDFDVWYKTKVTGVISKGTIRYLSGVQVHILFFWLNINEVDRDGNDLIFTAGILSLGFAIGSYDDCPQCGCGFDCVNYNLAEKAESSSRFNWKRLVSAS